MYPLFYSFSPKTSDYYSFIILNYSQSVTKKGEIIIHLTIPKNGNSLFIIMIVILHHYRQLDRF